MKRPKLPFLEALFQRASRTNKIKIYSSTHFSKVHLALFGLVFAGIGSYLIFSSFAAVPAGTIEPEAGTVTSPATVIDDATASGGQAIRFGTAASGGSCPASTPNVPDGPDAFDGCYPGPETTGIPEGTTLTSYTGPCEISSSTTITAKTVNCRLEISGGAQVTITNSLVNGGVYTGEWPNSNFITIRDSEINAGDTQQALYSGWRGIEKNNFLVERTNIYGGISSAWCEYNCTIKDSYLHGQGKDLWGCTSFDGARWCLHQSGVRLGSGSVAQGQRLEHNTIVCDAQEVQPLPGYNADTSGCSADITGYGDFATIQNNTVIKNLLGYTTGGTCAYGGSSDGGKPYPNGTNNKFHDNVFQRGPSGWSQSSPSRCGYYFAMTDLNPGVRGNEWVNNKFDDGTAVTTN